MLNLDKKFDDMCSNLTKKEEQFFRNVKDKFSKVYSFIKPFLLGIAIIYIFTRIKKRIGFEDAFYLTNVIIIIFLRLIYTKLSDV